MKRLLLFACSALIAAASLAATSVSVSHGTWDLYRGSAIATDAAGNRLENFANELGCIEAARSLNVTRAYTCRTRTGVTVLVTADPPPPPPKVDCLTNPVPPAWAEVVGDWTACANSVQTRTTLRTRTVVTQPANGGAACPSLSDPIVESRSCSVDPPPPPPVGTVTQSPPVADLTVLKPGDVLVLKPGVYTSLKLKSCAGAYCRIVAETDGTVTLPQPNFTPADWHLAFEGVKFKGTGSTVVTASYLKFIRVAFEGGPGTGNSVSVQIGTNDRTPGADHILVEDSWAYGAGGRYKVLVYNSDSVVLRRVVARHDGGWKYDQQNPQGGITVYDSTNVALEDVACVDSVQGLDGFESCIYLVSNTTTSKRQANVTLNGAIVIDSPNNGIGAEGRGAAATYTLNDALVINSAAGGLNTNNEAHVINATRVSCSVKGVCFGKWSSGGVLRVTGCKFGKGTLASGATLVSCPGGAGADLTSRFGVSGTLFGEPGFDQPSADPLWPWPNEARMKADFDSVRPAFGGQSFTDYVRTRAL